MADSPQLMCKIIYVNSADGEEPDSERANKVTQLVMLAIQKFREFLAAQNGPGQSVRLACVHAYGTRQEMREDKTIQMFVSFEDVPETLPFTRGYTITFPFAINVIDALPDDIDGVFPAEEMKAYEWVMNSILHEMCHAFGAFHSNDGIMSGPVALYDNKDEYRFEDFDLMDHLDDHSTRILSEMLHRDREDSNCHFEYDEETKQVTFKSNVDMSAIFYLKKTAYTNNFTYLNNDRTVTQQVPDDDSWDAVYVLSFFGTATYFTREAIKSNQHTPQTRKF